MKLLVKNIDYYEWEVPNELVELMSRETLITRMAIYTGQYGRKMKMTLKKIRRWIEVALCRHEWVETYHFEPNCKHRFICTKCGECR